MTKVSKDTYTFMESIYEMLTLQIYLFILLD